MWLDYRGSWEPPPIEVERSYQQCGSQSFRPQLSAITSDEELQLTLEVNLFAPLRLCRHFAPGMADAADSVGLSISIRLWGIVGASNAVEL